MSWRFRAVNAEGYLAERASGRAVVLVLWHGEMLPLLYYHRDQQIGVLVSEHGDGEIIARILSGFGFRLIRGSTSRGAARALIAVDRELREGHVVGITPDGPRGPRHSVAPGALLAAHRANVKLVSLAARASSFWRLGSWDQFIIPKPFSTITIAYGDPTPVPADSSRAAAEMTDLLSKVMNETQRAAASY